jgi:hypothetical protein
MANNTIKVTEPPKIPTLKFKGGIPSIFSGNKGYVPKGNPNAKFNKPVFMTQHKGGTVGGGK